MLKSIGRENNLKRQSASVLNTVCINCAITEQYDARENGAWYNTCVECDVPSAAAEQQRDIKSKSTLNERETTAPPFPFLLTPIVGQIKLFHSLTLSEKKAAIRFFFRRRQPQAACGTSQLCGMRIAASHDVGCDSTQVQKRQNTTRRGEPRASNASQKFSPFSPPSVYLRSNGGNDVEILLLLRINCTIKVCNAGPPEFTHVYKHASV